MKNQLSKEQWDALDKDIKDSYAELKLAIEYNYGNKEERIRAKKQLDRSKKTTNSKKPKMTSSKAVFNFDLGKSAIQDYNSSDISKRFKSYVFQVKTMNALMEISPYVRKMSELV
jgi:hypothetical protein